MSQIAKILAGITLLTPIAVLAAATGAQQQPAASSGFFITFAIAYLSRRRAIGGWLLYFYLQMYLSMLISLLFVPQVISNLQPSHWGNAQLYVMFFLSVVPVLIAQLAEIVAATVLLVRRSEPNLNFLRYVLTALGVASIVSIAIDLAYFKDDPAMVFDFVTAFFSIVWAAYFRKAKRVTAVFVSRNWSYETQLVKRVLKPEDKKSLRKRALVVWSVVFVLLLLLMGSALKDDGKAPDAGIFLIPLFYAFIAAAIAWYLPLKKNSSSDTVESLGANDA